MFTDIFMDKVHENFYQYQPSLYTHTSSSCISKYWITCRTAPNHLRNGHHTKLISGGWNQSSYVEDGSFIIVIESEKISPMGNGDLIAGNTGDPPEYRSLPVDSYKGGTNIHALNGDIYRLGWWNCMEITVEKGKSNTMDINLLPD